MTRTAAVALWLMLAGAVFALHLAALVTGHRVPTLGDAAGYALRPRAGRLLVLAGWVWLGWHVFVRSHPGG